MKLTTLILFIILFSLQAAAQTITTKPLKETAYCPGTPIEVSYEATGTFKTGNIFSLQISGPDGSFNNFRYLGNISSTTSGTYNITLPEDVSPGTKYRFRVISTIPYIVGTDNGKDIEVFPNLKNVYLYHNRYYYELGEPVNMYFSSEFLNNDNSKYIESINLDFGEDASPRFYSGLKPPSIKFSKPGDKNFVYDVKYKINCSYTSHDTLSNEITILDCNVRVDSNALVISSDTSLEFLNPVKYKQVWIMPNKVLKIKQPYMLDEFIFILENASSVIFEHENRYSITYMKSGSILRNGIFGHQCVYIQMPEAYNDMYGAKKDSSFKNLFIDCDSLGIDYTNAPALGKKILGISGIKETQAISDFKITPNPANDNLNLEYYLSNPGNVRISLIIQIGLEIVLIDEFVPAGNQALKLPLDNSFNSGVYFIKLQAGSEVKYKKVVISR